MTDNFGITLNEFVSYLFSNLDKHSIPYVVMRNYKTLPYSIDSEDIDILVLKKDLESITKILLDHKKIMIIDKIKRASVLNFFIYGIQVNDSKNALQVDFNYNCPWKGFEYLLPSEILDRRKIFKTPDLEISIPDEIDETVLSIFTHYIISNTIREKYLINASLIFKNNFSETKKRLTKYCGTHYSGIIINNIINNELDSLLLIRKEVCFNILKHNLIKHPLKSLYKNVRHFYIELSLMYFKKHLFTIAILGPDGAGKSTIIDNLLKKISGIKKTITLQHLKPVYLNKGNVKKRGVVTDPHAKKPRNSIASFIKLIVWACESWFYYLFTKRKNSTLEIFDRYFDDILVDPKRYRCSTNLKLVKLISKLIPRPNLFFVLVANPETIQKRKQEVPFEETESQVHKYTQFSHDQKNSILINTDKDIKQNTNEILSHLVTNMHKKNQ